MDPFVIFMGGKQLKGYTQATLTRTKKGLTGKLSVTIFYGYMPTKPVARMATSGAKVQVYVGGALAFVGTVDGRTGKGNSAAKEGGGAGGGGGGSTSIGADSYVVVITARGKTKALIKSSQQHPTSTMLQPTDKDVVKELLKGHDIQLDWKAPTVKLDKIRLRDGNRVIEELRRLAVENAHHIYETREGKLRVVDAPAGAGEALVLGDNILTFNATQSESTSNSEIQVKGQFTDKKKRGKDAVIGREKVVKNSNVKSKAPVSLQHYGNATDEALERRGKFEADSQTADDNQVTIEVFHVQPKTGAPWDIGNMHYVEIPLEGIFNGMECIGLTYNVTADKKLSTKLTLAPPPTGSISGGKAFGSKGIPPVSDLASMGKARMLQAGITLVAGQFPQPWISAALKLTDFSNAVIAKTALETIIEAAPPLELPLEFRKPK